MTLIKKNYEETAVNACLIGIFPTKRSKKNRCEPKLAAVATAVSKPPLNRGGFGGPSLSLQNLRRVVGQTRTLAARQGNVTTVAPALEAIDHIGQP